MKFIQTINSSANKFAKGMVGIFAIKLMLFGGAFLIQSCQTDEIEDTQSIEQELLDYINSSSFKQLEINFPNLVRGLDYKTFTSITENDITVYSFKSRSNNLSLGSLFFLKNINDEYKTIVETYTHDNNLNIKTASYDNVYSNNMVCPICWTSIVFYVKTLEIQKNIICLKSTGRYYSSFLPFACLLLVRKLVCS